MENKTVLLITDKTGICSRMTGILERIGYSCVYAENLETAAQIVRSETGNETCLILADIDMYSEEKAAESDYNYLLSDIPTVLLLHDDCSGDRVDVIPNYGCVAVNCGEAVFKSAVDTAQRLRSSEEELYASKAAGLFIAEHLPFPVFIKNSRGKYSYVNPAFSRYLGYDENELIGKSELEILPQNAASIAMNMDTSLIHDDQMRVYETSVIDRDGGVHDVMFMKARFPGASGFTSGIAGGIIDSASQKKSKQIINGRLRLLEFSIDHSLKDTITMALDDVCGFSESEIAFYYFMDYEGKSLMLQSWSGKEEPSLHEKNKKYASFKIDDIGMWYRSFRGGVPVIHNDLKSGKDRHVFPDSNIHVERELVVPIFRKERVVALLGVGNKKTDYTEDDVELVSFFADVAWEIAEKKKSMDALIRSEEKYKLLLDTANEVILIAQDGLVKFMNLKAFELLETADENDILMKPFVNFIFGDDRDFVFSNYSRRIKGEDVKTGYAFRIKSFMENIKWVEVRSIVVEWDGKPATINFLTDITREKLIENELKTSELFSQATLNSLSTCIAILDSTGIIISTNTAWQEFALSNSDRNSGLQIGGDYLALCDASSGSVSCESGTVASAIRSIISGEKENLAFEFHCTSSDEAKWFSMRITRFSHDSRLRIVVAHDNITERKHAESEIKRLLNEKDILLKEVHHRIKNNMNTINGFLTIQSDKMDDAGAKFALKEARNRVLTMMVLYDKLYCTDNFEEVSAGHYLPALIDEIAGNFPDLNRKKISIETEIEDFILDVKKIAPLGIIINELLTNTMKYAFSGMDEGKITVKAFLKPSKAVFVVSDNGIGIPESVDLTSSSGFGMHLIRRLAEQIDGKISIDRGKGSSFTLEFKV